MFQNNSVNTPSIQSFVKNKIMYTKLELDIIAKHCSEMEAKATKAERDSIKFKQTEFMQNKIGQSFEGVVSGVNSWGIFVEIKSSGCEGNVDFDELTNLGFVLDEKNYKFVKDGNKIALGDTVNVTVAGVNLAKRHIDFNLSTNE